MSTDHSETLRERLALHADIDSAPEAAPARDETDDDIVAQGVQIASERAMQVRRYLQQIEEAQATQPERLAQARSQAEDERIKALTVEPWADVVTSIPTVDFGGMLTLPTINGKELFGTRLAFDLLGCCTDEEQVAEKLREYFRMVREPAQMFLVCAAALDTIASHVAPALLDVLEQQASDYDTRVRMADAARNAWTARVADLAGDHQEEGAE